MFRHKSSGLFRRQLQLNSWQRSFKYGEGDFVAFPTMQGRFVGLGPQNIFGPRKDTLLCNVPVFT